MSDALRLQALTLPVGELAPVDKFYRWALAMKPAEEAGDAARALGWGHEDRLRLVDAAADPDAEEGVTLRLSTRPLEGLVDWLAERGLSPASARVPPEDADAARAAWPGADVFVLDDDVEANRLLVSVRGPDEPRLDLFAPLPKETLVARKRMGPFTWKTKDWKGLEVPGLLGVELGSPEPGRLTDFLESVGLEPGPGEEPDAPLAAGDHQVRIAEREPAGIYGLAVVVGESRVKDIARTLETLEAEYRHEKNRILAADPAGRVLLVHGVHGR
ncbi:MAG: hypothetical protein KY397_05310 [Gemmatimonadetes bacterium]|nr:hypothetical protein [Gemmatimonadota bacterium]